MPFSIKSFEDYLDRTGRCRTPEELFNVYIAAVRRHGFDRAMFGLLTDHDDIGEKAGIGICYSYPQDWMDYYHSANLGEIDPVVQYSLSQPDAFTWDETHQALPLTKEQKDMLAQSAEAGLHNGLCISFRGGPNQVGAIGLATSEVKDSFDGRVDLINAYSQHFYFRFREMKKQAGAGEPAISLTAREREVLTWAALGKSNSDIAAILTISVHTIDFHMRNIFKKLKAPSRVVAIVKAISSGLITP